MVYISKKKILLRQNMNDTLPNRILVDLKTIRKPFLSLFMIAICLFAGCGKSLEERHSEKYNICGKEIINKEIGGFIGTVQEPSLFIFLLQDKGQSNKLKISVTQKNGYSVSHINIASNMLQKPVLINGKGKYWGDSISSKFRVDRETYEYEVILPQSKLNLPISFHIEVKYWWTWRGKGTPVGKFINKSNTTRTTLSFQ